MSDASKTSLRIDWFDGTLIEETRSNDAASSSAFADEEPPEAPPPSKPQYTEKKPIGFKRLLDISLLKPPLLTLEVAHRPGFWNLFDSELKGDFIVLIVKVLANIYKSLEPGEKSRISNLLKSKFEKSYFLNLLKEFLIDLPQVRIVEKRMNSQLWDDAESFYVNVVSLCEGIVDLGGNDSDLLSKIYELLEVAETSAIGVREEHMETFSNDMFIRIHQLQLRILNSNSKDPDQAIQQTNTKTESEKDPNTYKNLDIFPSRDDLLGNSKMQLQPNIINGAYPSVKHYLDLQFKLLREDCFGPLRDGICKYIENPTKRRFENIRVFPKVRILRTFVSNNKVGHLVDIAWKERINHGLFSTKKYAYNKQLMFGSLLLFTSDNFETILCATVLDSSISLLMDGYIAVSFQNPVSNKIFSEPFIMVESEVFFEPYHRVLRVLQNLKNDDLPMKRYIVDVQTETHPPAYLSLETIYSIIDPEKSEELPFPVLDTTQWPTTKAFGLDDSQMEAYKFALTKEFAVIQGPPGTGKTFIGVKIASTLLRNLSLEGTPMLIICYTNHALDQFLEGILNVTKNILRLGSQSKNKNLDAYTLHNLRGKIKCKYSYLYGSKRAELEKIFKQMTELQTEIEKCEREIVSYKTLKPHLKIGDKVYELKTGNEDPILSWLFEDTKIEFDDDDDDELEDWEKQLDEGVESDTIETCFSEEWALKEIDSMLNSIKYVKDVTDDHLEGQKMTDKFEGQISKVRNRLNCFKRFSSSRQADKEEKVIDKVSDLYSLTLEQRWNVYYSALSSIMNKLSAKMNTLLEQHNTCTRELDEVSTLVDGEVARTVRVVGVTTSAAARRRDLLQRLLSPVVIVEEAAEVMEAHIVAPLTHHCQHLILIGDHKQLRPTAAHYKLAKDYNLEVSLFERMIRNGVHARTLATQRRMRPQFVELLVPTIYPRLDSHTIVHGYPDVRGVAKNLYFCSHDALEDSEGMEDSWSHKNLLEAKWCVALADYLRLMEYKAAEITILATYTGQVTLIKELSKKHDSLRDVKITAVDNYQGEENRIVILSLVRSNRDGKIGFLAASNRICVALSRAKEGFYMFGNMNILKSASNVWRAINEKLTAQDAIGNRFHIRCHIHKENTLEISDPEGFDAALSDTCLKICDTK